VEWLVEALVQLVPLVKTGLVGQQDLLVTLEILGLLAPADVKELQATRVQLGLLAHPAQLLDQLAHQVQ
jgi:hypothetical protein